MSRLQTLWYDRMSGRHKHSDLNDPMFEASRDVQDWRNYVGAYVQQIWKTLDGQHRAAIALDADERASREEWD